MANPIGRFARRMRETRGQRPEGLVCLACSRPPKYQRVRRCRILQGGELLPGVQCPRCLKAWVEQEEKAAPMEAVSGE